jgi:hypothetical protein
VIPIHITENWNLITRVITPIVNQPSLAPGLGTATGLGDINPTFFLSPAKPGELIWGVGPTFTLPTASDRLLGSGQWSMGPAGVVLTIQGHWVLGALMNNQWSFAGWGDKPVNSFLLQPFVNYNFPHGWYLSSAPILTANWKADKAGDVWTIPFGGGVGKLFRLGEILPLEGDRIAKLPNQHSIAGLRQPRNATAGPEVAVAVPNPVPFSEIGCSVVSENPLHHFRHFGQVYLRQTRVGIPDPFRWLPLSKRDSGPSALKDMLPRE